MTRRRTMRYLRTASSARLTPLATAVLTVLTCAVPAQAAEIETGNPDVALRIDNTLRLNLGFRTQAQDKAILANPNYDDGDRNFNKGKPVAERVDLLTEADLVVNKKWGLRMSTAAWADGAYSGLSNTNDA